MKRSVMFCFSHWWWPPGAFAAAILAWQVHDVTVLEETVFPRYHIGELLLLWFHKFLGVADAVKAASFVEKPGVHFE